MNTNQDFTLHMSLVGWKNLSPKTKKHENVIMTPETRWWNFKYFLFSPLLGEDSQFDYMISFQMGWFNHQLGNHGDGNFGPNKKNSQIAKSPRIRESARKSWSVIRRSITVIMWFQIQDRLQDHMGQKCLDWWKQLMLAVFFLGMKHLL